MEFFYVGAPKSNANLSISLGIQLSDDPRTPVNLYPLKGDVDYSPHTAQSEIILHVSLCLTMHINY